MRIINQSGVELVVNGVSVYPNEWLEISEMMFNTQAIFSNIGSIEITTEYGKRSFQCFGNLKAYEDETRRDSYELPYIIIEGATNGCDMTQELINQINTNIGCCQYHLSCPDCGETWWDNDAFPIRCPKCGKERWNR